MTAKLKVKSVCCIEHCNDLPVARGLCRNCYKVALNMVNAGKTTWEELFDLGLTNKGVAKQSLFVAAFEKAKADSKRNCSRKRRIA